jgi:histidinol-phosphate aminotransferase
MSRFFSNKFSALTPYTPGEQPKERKYIKLNTNESPFPPSPLVLSSVANEAGRLQLYCDPEYRELSAKFREVYGLPEGSVILTNGSDEVLNFAFMAWSDKSHPIAFPEITYGFYEVFAQLNGIPYEKIPLRDDFTVCVDDYIGIKKNVVIANPNAPTGISLSLSDVEKIVKSNPDNVVIIDEAYVDFGGESAIRLAEKYNNLLVTGTFSKSRSMAGARLGFGIACPELIADLNTIRYSTNPYNVNRCTQIAGYSALCENDYYMDNCKKIIKNREELSRELSALGFTMTPSVANFVFAKSDEISGERLYLELKSRGILVRHFSSPKISDYNRITVGTREECLALVSAVKEILGRG